MSEIPVRYIVISDLHLGRGLLEENQPGPALELFRHDGAFARFVDDARRRAADDGYIPNLILLGDFLDFPRVPSPSGTRAGTDAEAIARLDQITRGHPAVFESLTRFMDAGGVLHVLPGNHDVELMRPEVRASLLRTLDPRGAGKILWYPWFMLIPDLLYAEHGNQYHDINSFPALVEMEHTPISGATRPIGALYDEHVIHLTQLVDAHSASSTIRISRIFGTLARNPAMFARSLPMQTLFTFRFLAQGLAMWRPVGSRRRKRYRTEDLAPYAGRMNLPVDTVIEIDRVAAEIASGLWRRLRHGAWVMARRKIGGRQSAAERVDDLGFPSSPAQRAALLREVAGRIDNILAAAGKQAPFYVFGHTHLADCSPIGASTAGATCLNSGSWLASRRLDANRDIEQPLMTFVEIDRVPERHPSARLLIWDDERGSPEPYIPAAG